MKTTGSALAAALGACLLLAAPGPALETDTLPCPCGELLEALVIKVEASYPGYHLEVKGRLEGPYSEAAYREHLAATRARAAAAPPGLACTEVLQDYVAWFEEGHLFVGGRPPIATAADSARLRAEAPRVGWTDVDVLAYLEAAGAGLDPVEGIWFEAPETRIAVVRASSVTGSDLPAPPPSDFVAFVLDPAPGGWSPGDVKATLDRLPDGSYEVVQWDEARRPTRPHVYVRGQAGGGRLQRDGLLLHMPPTTWGKLHPVRPGTEGLVDPVDPRAPTARTVGDDAVVFHVPSHLPSHAKRLYGLVERYRGALERADVLVVDLRGNEGGSAFVTNPLLPWILTPGRRPARHYAEGESSVLVSEDLIAIFERTSWAPPGLVDRMRAAEPGTLVPFADPAPEGDAAGEDEPGPPSIGPRHVAVLTDAMTVSAAEAFVLRAMRSTKVTLFGQPTGSSIDYQTVSVVRFGCPEAGLYVGLPTIVGSDRLPEGGVRPTGIVPDVLIDPSEADPVGWIVERYRSGGGD